MLSDKYIKHPNELKTTSKKIFRLAIEVSTVLHIEIPEVAIKIKSELIGIKQNHCLIAGLPGIVNQEFVDKCNQNVGTAIVCRYVFEGSVFGFRSTLMGITTSPVQFMILEYPKNAEECNLRRQKRVSIVLPSMIKFGSIVFYGSIVDLSDIGCLLVILHSAFDNKDMKVITETAPDNVILQVDLPGGEKDVLIPVIRRNIRHDTTKVYIGLEFSDKELDSQTKDTIKRYVAEMRKYSMSS